jgi:hypothetical protein
MSERQNAETRAGAGPETSELFIGVEVPRADEAVASTAKTLAAERRSLRRFAVRVGLFFAPIVLLVSGIELVLWRAGETWPLERVITAQEQNPHAFFSRDIIDHGTFRYKYLQVLRRHPQILVLGSSRVMQFRAEMFGAQGADFYNAGGMIHSIEDLNNFVDRLPPEITPKTVILGIDFWWLNANIQRTAVDSFSAGVKEDGTYDWQGHANAVAGYFRHPRTLVQLIRSSFGKKYNPNAIGLQALLRRMGFRADGSKRFDLKIPNTTEGWNRRFPPAKKIERYIRKGEFPFAFTEGVSQPLLEQLRAAILKLKGRGTFVIVYSPPVIAQWDRVASVVPGQKEYWREYHETLPRFFQALDVPFFDVVTTEQAGLDDRYMRDRYHAYETFTLYVLRRFCGDAHVRTAFPDVVKVADRALASPKTNPLIPDLPDSVTVPANSASEKTKRRHSGSNEVR